MKATNNTMYIDRKHIEQLTDIIDTNDHEKIETVMTIIEAAIRTYAASQNRSIGNESVLELQHTCYGAMMHVTEIARDETEFDSLKTTFTNKRLQVAIYRKRKEMTKQLAIAR